MKWGMFAALRLGIVAALLQASAIRATATAARAPEQARWAAHAAAATITRDDWGIPHIHGHTDADAVFAMVYAQAEDDFNRVEANYLTALGRRAEVEGPALIWQDLRQRLFVDETALRVDYARSPGWLRDLMVAWADGLNFYLATHPETKPKALIRFEPWMALAFSDGSIGGDIEEANLARLEAFYGGARVALTDDDRGGVYHEPKGSNGIAIAPSLTANGHALLLINPHTSFFFRAEAQVTSDTGFHGGLDAYGAATWGQFFLYQGWNRHAGWMHTSSGVDSVDEFAETIERRGGKLFYRYGGALRPVAVRDITIAVRQPDGSLTQRRFTTYATHHRPVVRAGDGANGKWIALALMNRPVEALEQSFLRTKAIDLASFRRIAALRANSSNNTVFVDDHGTIAFLMPQFVPRRDPRFDYTRPVDGSDPAADWHGLTPLDRLPQVVNPATGWLRNTNDWPWAVAGAASPRAADYPAYLDQVGENPRGVHATMLLEGRKGWTLDGLIGAAFDPYLPAFAQLLPSLFASFDALPTGDARRARLAAPVALLRAWDDRWGAQSTATSLAVFWGEALWRATLTTPPAVGLKRYEAMAAPAAGDARLAALDTAVARLQRDFGDWRVPWGRINRFQRLTGAIRQPFDDAKPSIPVPFTSAQWGSLASFGAAPHDTKKYYGTTGNSFVAAVEFGGPRVVARAVTAGGESGDPASRHFDDQAGLYASGRLRPVYFYPDELAGHIERVYHPGD